MKKTILLLFVLLGLNLSAQEQAIKKPAFVIIANNKIITEDQLGELAQKGLIKSMNKGVSQADRDKYAEQFGDKIGDKEFIILIDVKTDQEKSAPAPAPTTEKDNLESTMPKDVFLVDITDAAPDFTLEMLSGEHVALSDLKGKVVLISYWATWCGPCLMELSEFPEKILAPYENDDFVLLAISIGEKKEKVIKKMSDMKKYGVNYDVGIDPDRIIWSKYASGSIPKNLIIDKKGIVRYQSAGNSKGSVDKLAAEIKKLLAEK